MRVLKSVMKKAASIFLSMLFVFSIIPKKATQKAFADAYLMMDKTSVENDLGEINPLEYPKNPFGKPSLHTFMEYGYSDDPLSLDFYALYVYVYNPAQLTFSTVTGVSSVNMGIEYEKDGNGSFAMTKEGDAIAVKEYRNMRLKYCGATTGENENLFVKFRVMDVGQVLSNVQEMEGQGYKRQYDIVGIQLFEAGKDTAVDYPVSKTIFYTGFAKGYGKGAEDKATLSCEWLKNETVELEVHDTFYRIDNPARGEGHQSQVNTVYFALPKRYLEEYGKLQRIMAEWYEYVLRPFVVTEDATFYNEIQQYLGVDTRPYRDGSGVWAGEYGLAFNPKFYWMDGQTVGEGGWNNEYAMEGHISHGNNAPIFQKMFLAFLTDDIDAYDPYREGTTDGTINNNVLYERIKTYSQFKDGTLPIKNGTISADLFENDIDDSRKIDNEHGKVQRGYSYYDFNADYDILSMQTWDDTDDKIGGWFYDAPAELSRVINPIRILKEEDFALHKTAKEISEDLCVDINKVQELKDFYDTATFDFDGPESNLDEEQVVVLFRFAVTDYYARQATIVKEARANLFEADTFILNKAYVAYQSVFLDFDVIQLTFNDEGKTTVLGVVASPVDVIAPVTPPTNYSECGNFTMGHLVAILFIGFIGVVIWWLVDFIKTSQTNTMIKETYKATVAKTDSKKKDNKKKKPTKKKASKTKRRTRKK